MPLVADRAVLVPTAEEDRALDLDVLQDFFRLPAGYIFLTPEEAALVEARAATPLEPAAIIGMGLDLPPAAPDAGVLRSLALPDRYVLYLGRVDRNKGCHTLLDYFQEYVEGPQAPGSRLQAPGLAKDVTLVLAGPAKIRVPEHPRIRALGYVSDDVRHALLCGAQALVVPSPYESLSIVLLEAWNRGVPALVNAHCAVLKGQVRRGNGGLFYRSQREFAEGLDYLLTHDAERAQLGQQGRAYVDREYRWPTVLARVEALLEQVSAQRPDSRSPGAEALDLNRHGNPHAPADAERRDANAAASRAQRVDERREHARATGTNGMAERDRAATRVHERGVEAQLAQHRHGLRGERFVQLEQMHLTRVEPGPLEHQPHGADWTKPHDARLEAHDRIRQHARHDVPPRREGR